MPEGMRAGGKSGIVQAPPPHQGLYIWQAIAWQATLDFGGIDLASGISAPHPCAKIWTGFPRYVTESSLVPIT
jgi:hypothetical protein